MSLFRLIIERTGEAARMINPETANAARHAAEKALDEVLNLAKARDALKNQASAFALDSVPVGKTAKHFENPIVPLDRTGYAEVPVRELGPISSYTRSGFAEVPVTSISPFNRFGFADVPVHPLQTFNRNGFLEVKKL